MLFQPTYNRRKALIIGINKYQNVSPLSHATNDATAIAEILKTKYNFVQEDIILLTDNIATKENIFQEFHNFTQNKTEPDDKLLVFFAGHGHTIRGNRGEVGFLVPVDGTSHNTNSLIRWNDLTSNAELIKAKHILFIMDACYGGLAITRSPATGSRRFLKDMCQRYSRQVITAGKADECVADAGGPLEVHSIFTGHLLQGLNGAAASEDGIITANGIMSYVYEKVGNDPHSHQTPHYGYVDGDGDFIFNDEALNKIKDTTEYDSDVLIEIPSTPNVTTHTTTISSRIKELISLPSKTIELHDFAIREVRRFLDTTSKIKMPLNISYDKDSLIERIKAYEKAIENLSHFFCIISYWGNGEQSRLLETMLKRLTDNNSIESGQSILLSLRWYPICLLQYIAGIAAVAARRYDNLSIIFNTQVDCELSRGTIRNIVVPMIDAMTDLNDVFKNIPGHERNFVPRSEYVFKLLQPKLEEALFLGRGYESMFDRFEMFLSLVYAHVAMHDSWGPMGRFGWKTRQRIGGEPIYDDLLKEAEREKNNWLPLKAGFFNSSYEQFKQVWEKMFELMKSISWF